ncbi:MAG: class 1 fructose-bisphosphatase [Gammaproteobacteria bacterium]|nr:class 1 fructose-bisphosphatase [Gammaproteobacteria bacterium]
MNASVDLAVPTGILADADIVTLQSHMLEEKRRVADPGDTLSWIISALSISAKIISAQLRRAGLDNVLGSLGNQNVQGEDQQKLDVIANNVLMRALGAREGVMVLASEEADEPVVIAGNRADERGYCVLFDPLDGSSNLDVCGGVGTIFSILRHDRRSTRIADSVLQPGARQVAAGYVLYGPSTVMVLTTGAGVDMFVLDTAIGAFIRIARGLRIPETGATYSLNEGNRASFPAGYRAYLDWAQANGYSSRYAGAMVADVHRTLLKGGVFLYPPTQKAPQGKLRLLYEASPMAMIIEQAGGQALAGTQRILDIQPTALHQRTPVLLGSSAEVAGVAEFLDRAD